MKMTILDKYFKLAIAMKHRDNPKAEPGYYTNTQLDVILVALMFQIEEKKKK